MFISAVQATHTHPPPTHTHLQHYLSTVDAKWHHSATNQSRVEECPSHVCQIQLTTRIESAGKAASLHNKASPHSLQVDEDVGDDDREGSPGSQQGDGVQALEEEPPNSRGEAAQAAGKRETILFKSQRIN